MALEDKIKIKGRWFFIKAKPTQKYKYTNTNLQFYRMYSIYKKNVKETNVVTNRQHTKITNMFFDAVSRKIISDGFIFYMPYGLGNIRINRVEYCGLPKQRAYFRAWDKHYTIQWDKENAKFKNKNMYHFKVRKTLQHMKYKKIIKADEDPTETDMVGYNRSSKYSYDVVEVMKKEIAYKEAQNLKLPPKERPSMEDILKQLQK